MLAPLTRHDQKRKGENTTPHVVARGRRRDEKKFAHDLRSKERKKKGRDTW